MTPNKKLSDVRTALHEVVEEAGYDFRYEPPTESRSTVGDCGRCVNVHEGRPHCIVGRIVAHLGVSVEVLAEFRDHSAGVLCGYLDNRRVMSFTSAAEDYLTYAQSEQDPCLVPANSAGMHDGPCERRTWKDVMVETDHFSAIDILE